MSDRLTQAQRRVLEELVHVRMVPEDAWLTTSRLSTLTERNVSRTWDTLDRLWDRGLVLAEGRGPWTERRWRITPKGVYRWRITDKGREALG